MPGLQPNTDKITRQKLSAFLANWPLDKVKNMALEEYTNVSNKNTFCYWLEFETEILGRIGGKPSNKFGIWRRKNNQPIKSTDFLFDNEYAWYRKYGKNPSEAFETVRNHIVKIIESAQSGNFSIIDRVDLDSLTRWKIAFLYSNYSLLPVYKKTGIRKIAKHFEHPNYDKAPLSELHPYIVNQKPKDEDFFDFAYKQFFLAEKEFTRNYYIIGTKYGDEHGNDTINIMEYMLRRNVIATGFFWDTDFSNLYRRSYKDIYNWCDKHIGDKSGKYNTAKRTLSYLLQLRPGDIIAIKSHGQYGTLTIVGYAEVKEANSKVYEHDGDDFPHGLGHIVNVVFLETNLWINTGLNYAQTIHQIIPGEREGHFEKIFGSYALLERDIESQTGAEDDIDIGVADEESRINEKNTEGTYRTVTYTKLVSRIHDKLQIAFAKSLREQFPNDTIRTETANIDIKRENNHEIYYYEVKPFNSAYSCIREGIGQLLDYCHTNPNESKTIHLRIVGKNKPTPQDLEFIEFVKSNLNICFDYIAYDL